VESNLFFNGAHLMANKKRNPDKNEWQIAYEKLHDEHHQYLKKTIEIQADLFLANQTIKLLTEVIKVLRENDDGE
jgi:outer membrane biogenesis lipoprotein LolB